MTKILNDLSTVVEQQHTEIEAMLTAMLQLETLRNKHIIKVSRHGIPRTTMSDVTIGTSELYNKLSWLEPTEPVPIESIKDAITDTWSAILSKLLFDMEKQLRNNAHRKAVEANEVSRELLDKNIADARTVAIKSLCHDLTIGMVDYQPPAQHCDLQLLAAALDQYNHSTIGTMVPNFLCLLNIVGQPVLSEQYISSGIGFNLTELYQRYLYRYNLSIAIGHSTGSMQLRQVCRSYPTDRELLMSGYTKLSVKEMNYLLKIRLKMQDND